MKPLVVFILAQAKKISDGDLSTTANAVSFKLLLALFPFLLFLLTVAGFLDLDLYALLYAIDDFLPAEVIGIMESFGEQVIGVHMTGLLYASLVMAGISSTSAFRTLVAGINKAYSMTDTRHPALVWLLSFLLVNIFILALIINMGGLIFIGVIESFVVGMNYYSPAFTRLQYFLSYLVSFAFTVIAVLATNYFAISNKLPVRRILPGACFTVVVWMAASYGFSFFVGNFSRMGAVYGSVWAVMVLMTWLNIICRVLLYGGAVNAAIQAKVEGGGIKEAHVQYETIIKE